MRLKGEMICVRDVLTGNQYESVRLASQMLKISEFRIKKNLDSGKVLRDKGRAYKFIEIKWGNKSTKTYPYKVITLPFGKYKGKEIRRIKDKNYLQWLVDKTNLDTRLKSKVRARLRKLHEEHIKEQNEKFKN
jgi:hypothetical protein|tara:strand:+ start:1075 stop:1473 length:399 start_codon:yes stop_codon:yes gene_type:complete